MKELAKPVLLLGFMLLASGAFAQKADDCKQEIIGAVSFWVCDDDGHSLADRAASGNKTAQYELGMAYLAGKGVSKNPAEAMNWFSQSAEQGVAAAYYQMGLMYADGSGVEQDYGQAVAQWTMAAMKGFGEAQFRLAQSYEQGTGIDQDTLQAYVWYALAANATLVPMQAAIDRRDVLQKQMSESQLESAETMRSSLYQQILMNKLMR